MKPPKLLVTGTYNGTAFDDNQYSAPPGSLEEEILATTNYDDDAADSREIATEILEEGPTRMPPKQQVEDIADDESIGAEPAIEVEDVLDIYVEPPLEEAGLTIGFEAGGGIRLFPPKLHPMADNADKGMFEDDVLGTSETAELAPSNASAMEAGGGVRVPPPKLTPMGEEVSGAGFLENEDPTGPTRRARAAATPTPRTASTPTAPRSPRSSTKTLATA